MVTLYDGYDDNNEDRGGGGGDNNSGSNTRRTSDDDFPVVRRGYFQRLMVFLGKKHTHTHTPSAI